MPKIKEKYSNKRIVNNFEMNVGQIGVILDKEQYGKIILKSYNKLVCLSDPSETWDNNTHFSKIELLDIGEEITLIQDK